MSATMRTKKRPTTNDKSPQFKIIFVPLHRISSRKDNATPQKTTTHLSLIFRSSFAHANFINMIYKNHQQMKPKLKSQFLSELFPNISEKTARRWLNREIDTNSQLADELSDVGYHRTTKLLTIKMQQIILNHI